VSAGRVLRASLRADGPILDAHPAVRTRAVRRISAHRLLSSAPLSLSSSGVVGVTMLYVLAPLPYILPHALTPTELYTQALLCANEFVYAN
jgi:hypothetical protein